MSNIKKNTHLFTRIKTAILSMTLLSLTSLSFQAQADSTTDALVAGSIIGVAVGLAIDNHTTSRQTTVIHTSQPQYGHSFYRERYYGPDIRDRYISARETYEYNHRYEDDYRHNYRHRGRHGSNYDNYNDSRYYNSEITVREALPRPHHTETGRQVIIINR